MADSTNITHIDTLELDPADGQQYVVELRDRLLELLLPCNTVNDVINRLNKLYPESEPIRLAIEKANEKRTLKAQKNYKVRHHSSSSSSASVFTGALHNIKSFAVAKVSNLIREGVIKSRPSESNEVSKFKSTLIESIIDDVLKLAGDFVKRQNDFIITRSDIRTAMHADKDLLDLFLSDDKSLAIIQNHPILAQISGLAGSGSLGDSSHHSQHKSNAFTYKQKVRSMVDSENSFIRALKLIMKVFKAQLERLPYQRQNVETLFCNIDELLELSTLLLTAFEDALEDVDPEVEDEVPYVGMEIFDLAQAEEFYAYFNFAYKRLCRDEQWKQAYHSIISDETMTSIKALLPSHSVEFDIAVKHLLPNYLLNAIVQFFENYKNICDLYELSKKHDNREDEMALKETISILIKTKRAIEELLEKEIDEKEIEPLDTKKAEAIRESLERVLEAELEKERNLPYMPPVEIYRFSEKDSIENIQFEDRSRQTLSAKDLNRSSLRSGTESEFPPIRYATLIKLVERLTYHKYQPTIVDCFLTTYRSFIQDPEELLDLLIERFKIPDPPLSVFYPNFSGTVDDLPEVERNAYRRYLRKFRQEYSKPVKMRVINVLRSWIKNHYYDFERHPTLLDKLNMFLEEVYKSDKVLRSLINSLKKLIKQKGISQKEEFEFMLSQDPPPIEWLSVGPNEKERFDILTLSPREFARQLTLIEFDLFRAIKPSELINVRDLGLGTKKENGYESFPNLRRFERHFTLFSYWIRKCIIEPDNMDRRSAIYNRAIEIMGYLRRELNNFAGLLSIGSAIESASINRIAGMNKNLPGHLKEILDEYRELTGQHQKELQAALKSCNPPCIPYVGSYQTKLIHAKEGNKTFIDELDTSTISPTLSNDEFQSSFSNSPATPISPRTPLPRATPNMPASATSTLPNQFTFSGSSLGTSSTLPRPMPINIPDRNSNMNGYNDGNNNINSGLSQSSSSTTLTQSVVGSFSPSHHLQFQHHHGYAYKHQLPQQPSTPASPKLLINFSKQLMRAKLVGEMSNYQNQPYCLTVQPEIQTFIKSIEDEIIKFATNLGSANGTESSPMDTNVQALTDRLDAYLYNLSLLIKPRTRA